MTAGSYDAIAAHSLEEIVESGQHEVLNWYVLFGAMQHAGRTPSWSTFVGTDVFNSNKVFAVYPTDDDQP